MRKGSLSARRLLSGLTTLLRSKRTYAFCSAALTLGVLAVGYADTNNWVNFWSGKWVGALVLVHVLLALEIRRSFGWLVGGCFFWCGGLALWVGTSPWATHWTWGQHWLIPKYARYGMYTYVTLLLASLALLRLPRWYPARWVLTGIWGASIAATFWQWQHFASPFTRVGFSGNASMNGCLIAALTPIAFKRAKYVPLQLLVIILAAWAVLLTGTTQPVVLLAGVLLVLAWYAFTWSGKLAVVGLVAGVLALGYSLSDDDFFRSNNRVANWQYLFTWWKAQTHWFWGVRGEPGMILFEQLQIKIAEWAGVDLRSMSGTYFWMHSDWLEILFQYGAVGLGLALGCAWQVLRWARGEPALVAALLGYGGMMVANYPLRLPIHLMCLVLLAWLAYGEGGSVRSSKSTAAIPPRE